MPFTYKALTAVWVFVLVLFALSASDAVTGRGVLLIAAAALAAPLTLGLWPKPRYDATSDRTTMMPR